MSDDRQLRLCLGSFKSFSLIVPLASLTWPVQFYCIGSHASLAPSSISLSLCVNQLLLIGLLHIKKIFRYFSKTTRFHSSKHRCAMKLDHSIHHQLTIIQIISPWTKWSSYVLMMTPHQHKHCLSALLAKQHRNRGITCIQSQQPYRTMDSINLRRH